MLADIRLIFWETTRACNLGCPHCRASAEFTRSSEELSTAEAKNFISSAASFSKPIFVFSGGEPLLRDDIYELINYAKISGLKPALATNAAMIDREVALKLKESALSLAAVSFYGATSASHDGFCGMRGAFGLTLNGIENLKNEKLPFQVNTTITKKNLSDIENLTRFALKIGAVSFHVFFLVPTGRGKLIVQDEISPNEYEEAFDSLFKLQADFSLPIKVTCAPHYHRILHTRRDGLNIGKGCLAGQSVCFISYKGEVFGCGYLPVTAGDLRRDNFKKIWFESEVFNTLRDESKLEGKCGICEYKNSCGGCRARAFAATGDYLKEEPDCVYQPLTAGF